MQVAETYIPGLKIIQLNKFTDPRGSFIKVFNDNFFAANLFETNFKESYFSVSQKNVLRGMHFQVPPFEHTKLVYVNQGAILDVVLDIRKNSITYGKYFQTRISFENPFLIYIPVGCAHGFLSLTNNTIVTYLQTSCYEPNCDKGIRFDSFGMDWGTKNPVISDRDRFFEPFEEFNSPFTI